MTEQQSLEQTLTQAQQAFDSQQQIIATHKRAHVEASEAHRRAQQALAENTDISDEVLDRLTREAAKASALVNQARLRLDEARVDLEPMQVALNEAQAALTTFVHEQACTKLTRNVAETRDRLRCMVTDLSGLLDALRQSAVEASAAQGIAPSRVDHLHLLHVLNALQGLDLTALRFVTTALPLPELAFGLFNERPMYLDQESPPGEAIMLALASQNPCKVLAARAAQKQSNAYRLSEANRDKLIIELDLQVRKDTDEMPEPDRTQIRAYRISRRMRAGETLTPVERQWSQLPELGGVRGDQTSSRIDWTSPNAERLDRLIVIRDSEARAELARKAS